MPKTLIDTKLFLYSQNNSGGSFTVNDHVAHNVLIEAIDFNHANSIAENVGIYFDGVKEGRDCSCCGNRWSRRYGNDGFETLEEYIQLKSSFKSLYQEEKQTRVYYLNGSKLSI